MNKDYPHNIDAERALLNILLMDDQKLEEVDHLITEADFYRPAHGYIFKAIKDLVSERKVPDLIALEDVLRKRDKYEEVGGLSYLVGLQEEVSLRASISQYATMIKEKAQLRIIIDKAMSLVQQCYQENENGIERVADSAQRIFNEISQRSSTDDTGQLSMWLTKTFEELGKRRVDEHGLTGVTSGFRDLDQMTGGFQASDLIIIGARPGVGKTCIALNMALRAAQKNYKSVLFSLEMSATQLTKRILAIESGVSYRAIDDMRAATHNISHIIDAAGSLASLPLFIASLNTITIHDIRSRMRKLYKEVRPSIMFIDYLGYIKDPAYTPQNKVLEVASVTAALKSLAKELNIPIVVLCQLSRGVENRVEKRPMMSDLRDSGAIEQDADIIMFLYRDFKYNPEADPTSAELIVSKHRNGPTGTVDLEFIPELSRFENR